MTIHFPFKAVLIISAFYICAASEVAAALFGDDIIIKNHQGNLKKTNPQGGFFIDTIFGNGVLNANSGHIKIGVVKGNLTATTSAGDIEITEAGGKVKTISHAGNILIRRAHGDVYAETWMGEIVIESAKSVVVNNNQGGDVRLYNIEGYSNVRARGNILLVTNQKNALAELCDLSSEEGDITLYLPETINADIEVRTPITENPTKETRISSDLRFTAFKQICTDKGKTLLLVTRFNNGGAKIRITIKKGDLYLRSQKLIRGIAPMGRYSPL